MNINKLNQMFEVVCGKLYKCKRNRFTSGSLAIAFNDDGHVLKTMELPRFQTEIDLEKDEVTISECKGTPDERKYFDIGRAMIISRYEDFLCPFLNKLGIENRLKS